MASSGHYHRRWLDNTSKYTNRTRTGRSLSSSIEPSTYGTSWNSVRWNKPGDVVAQRRQEYSRPPFRSVPQDRYLSQSPARRRSWQRRGADLQTAVGQLRTFAADSVAGLGQYRSRVPTIAENIAFTPRQSSVNALRDYYLSKSYPPLSRASSVQPLSSVSPSPSHSLIQGRRSRWSAVFNSPASPIRSLPVKSKSLDYAPALTEERVEKSSKSSSLSLSSSSASKAAEEKKWPKMSGEARRRRFRKRAPSVRQQFSSSDEATEDFQSSPRIKPSRSHGSTNCLENVDVCNRPVTMTQSSCNDDIKKSSETILTGNALQNCKDWQELKYQKSIDPSIELVVDTKLPNEDSKFQRKGSSKKRSQKASPFGPISPQKFSSVTIKVEFSRDGQIDAKEKTLTHKQRAKCSNDLRMKREVIVAELLIDASFELIAVKEECFFNGTISREMATHRCTFPEIYRNRITPISTVLNKSFFSPLNQNQQQHAQIAVHTVFVPVITTEHLVCTTSVESAFFKDGCCVENACTVWWNRVILSVNKEVVEGCKVEKRRAAVDALRQAEALICWSLTGWQPEDNLRRWTNKLQQQKHKKHLRCIAAPLVHIQPAASAIRQRATITRSQSRFSSVDRSLASASSLDRTMCDLLALGQQLSASTASLQTTRSEPPNKCIPSLTLAPKSTLLDTFEDFSTASTQNRKLSAASIQSVNSFISSVSSEFLDAGHDLVQFDKQLCKSCNGKQIETNKDGLSRRNSADSSRTAPALFSNRYAAHIPIKKLEPESDMGRKLKGLHGRNSSSSVESFQTAVSGVSLLDTADRQVERMINEARNKHQLHRFKFKQAIDYLDQIYEDIRKECDSTALHQSDNATLVNAGEKVKPRQKLENVNIRLPKYDEIPVKPAIETKLVNDRLDYTRKWLDGDIKAWSAANPKPDLLVPCDQEKEIDLDERSVGSCSAEVAAINEADRKHRRPQPTPDLIPNEQPLNGPQQLVSHNKYSAFITNYDKVHKSLQNSDCSTSNCWKTKVEMKQQNQKQNHECLLGSVHSLPETTLICPKPVRPMVIEKNGQLIDLDLLVAELNLHASERQKPMKKRRSFPTIQPLMLPSSICRQEQQQLTASYDKSLNRVSTSKPVPDITHYTDKIYVDKFGASRVDTMRCIFEKNDVKRRMEMEKRTTGSISKNGKLNERSQSEEGDYYEIGRGTRDKLVLNRLKNESVPYRPAAPVSEPPNRPPYKFISSTLYEDATYDNVCQLPPRTAKVQLCPRPSDTKHLQYQSLKEENVARSSNARGQRATGRLSQWLRKMGIGGRRKTPQLATSLNTLHSNAQQTPSTSALLYKSNSFGYEPWRQHLLSHTDTSCTAQKDGSKKSNLGRRLRHSLLGAGRKCE